MRSVVSKDWLRREIDAHMSAGWDMTKFWTSVELRKRREEGGPNWRYSFNPGEVPAGFEKRWAEIRESFEASYEVPEE
jgi:hypothetical protein